MGLFELGNVWQSSGVPPAIPAVVLMVNETVVTAGVFTIFKWLAEFRPSTVELARIVASQHYIRPTSNVKGA